MNTMSGSTQSCAPSGHGRPSYSAGGSAPAPISAMPPPSLSNLTVWFDHFDRDRNGILDYEEVVNGLITTLNTPLCEQEFIRGAVCSNWFQFDLNRNGSIDKQEFCAPGGLGACLVAKIQSDQLRSQQPHQQPAQPQSKTVRVAIPSGTEPGQMVQIPTGQGNQTANVIIPERSKWTYSRTGPPTFECTVPPKSVDAVQAANTTPPATNPQPPSPSGATPRPEWQPYESITAQAHQPPPAAMTAVNVPLIPKVIRPSGRRRALIIGINYTGTNLELQGRVNDANSMKGLLQRNGFPEDSCHMVVLTDSQSNPNYRPTSSNIFRAMAWLTQGLAEGDVLFFHFSGRGTQVPDDSGFEADGLNEAILPLDHDKKIITDDELWSALVYPLPSGVKLTALMDCSHSGTALDLPFHYRLKNSRNKKRFRLRHSKPPQIVRDQWMEDANPAHSQGDVVLFSSCEDSQKSADAHDRLQAGGVMTQSFISVYEQSSPVTYSAFMASIQASLKTRRFKQLPQLTASQPFDAKQNIFSLMEWIEPNSNHQIGRMKRQHVRPGRAGRHR